MESVLFTSSIIPPALPRSYNTQMKTERWINFIVSETETSLALLYSYMQFQKLLSHQDNVDKIDKNSEFWMLHNGAVQRSLFLYLGRLTDDSADGKSFADFSKHCIKNIHDFSRTEFLVRKPDILSSNPRFMENKTEPNEADMRVLFKLARPHNGFLRGACRDIRNKVFAHAILVEEHEYADLFSKVNLDSIEKALLVYWSISQHLWQSFYNARTLDPIQLEYSRKEDISKNIVQMVHATNLA